MNCLRCNTPNEEGAKFCKNCGRSLTYTPPVKDNNANQSLVYLLILMSWECFTWLIWFVLQKVIIPKLHETGDVTWDKVDKIYKTTGWTVDIISILLLIAFSIIIKSKAARIFLIVFTIIRIGMLLGYRVFDK